MTGETELNHGSAHSFRAASTPALPMPPEATIASRSCAIVSCQMRPPGSPPRQIEAWP
jgi:hypothetical protein